MGEAHQGRGPPSGVFQVGGAVRAGSLYVTRDADRDLPRALRDAEFAFVLAPRQMGKSSLKVRTAAALRAEGIRSVEIDLTAVGSQDVTPEQWYFGLVDEIAGQVGLGDALMPAWEASASLSPVHRFSRILRELIVPGLNAPVVVFIDEIDGVLALPFSTDDFFAAIRATYNRRAEEAAFGQLTFCLLGVAAPSDLVRDPARTPFNIGVGIMLEDFTRDQARQLLPGLQLISDEPRPLLDAVYDWTDGHPYMTQRICAALAEEGLQEGSPASRVLTVVQRLFLNPGPVGDSNLQTARDRLLRSGELRPEMLAIYRRLLEGAHIRLDERDSAQMALRLAGMVGTWRRDSHSLLKVRNRVFAQVFDLEWVREQEEERPFAASLARWLQSGRREDDVLRGRALAEAAAWARGRGDLTPEEAAFILLGLQVARSQELERAERDRAEQVQTLQLERTASLQERNNLQRRLVTALVGLLITLSGALVGFGLMYQRAEAEAEAARAATLEAQSALKAKDSATLARDEAAAAALAAVKEKEAIAREAEIAWLEARRFADEARAQEQRARDALDREQRAIANAATAQGLAQEAITEMRAAMARARQAREEAEDGARRAAEIERRARSTELSAKAIFLTHIKGEGLDALQAAVEAVTIEGQASPSSQAFTGLAEAIDAVGGPVLGPHDGLVWAAEFSRDGSQVVTASEDGAVRIFAASGGKLLRTVTRHEGDVRTVVFSPDGQKVLSGGDDGTARISRADGAGEPLVLAGHANVITRVAFSHRGDRAATASFDGTARLWDARTGELLHILRGHEDGISWVAFSPDDALLVTASRDHTACVWDVAEGRRIHTLKGHQARLSFAEFSPHGDRILTTSADGTARLWNPRTGDETDVMEAVGEIPHGAFSPKRDRLAFAVADGTVQLWEVYTGKRLESLGDGHHPYARVAFSPDGRQLAAVGTDLIVQLWDAETGDALHTLKGHNSQVLSVAFSPGGERLVTASGDRTARIWGVRGGLTSAMFWDARSAVSDGRFLGEGRSVVATSYDGRARLWRLANPAASPAVLNSRGDAMMAVDASSDGSLVATVNQDGHARLWDTRTGAPRVVMALEKGPLSEVEFSPDGRALLVVPRGEAPEVRDPLSGELLCTLTGHLGPAHQAHFSAGGGLVVSAGEDATARVWDRDGCRQLVSIATGGGPAQDARFDDAAERVVTASEDGNVRVWAARSGALIATSSSAHEGGAVTARLLDGGARMASVGRDGTARLWDARTGAQLDVRHESRNGIFATLEVSPDGERLLSATSTGNTLMWSAQTGAPLMELRGHYRKVTAARFSPDGRYALTTSMDQTVQVHPASVDALMELACRWLEPHPQFTTVSETCRPRLAR